MRESSKDHALVDDALTPHPESSSLRMWPVRLPDDSVGYSPRCLVGMGQALSTLSC